MLEATIYFFVLFNADSTCVWILVGVSGRFHLCKRDMMCRRAGIRVGSTLFLIPRLTGVFLSFSYVSSPFLY